MDQTIAVAAAGVLVAGLNELTARARARAAHDERQELAERLLRADAIVPPTSTEPDRSET